VLGKGSPTVIFDAGTGDPGIARVEGTIYVDVLAKRNRVCAYDRAGLGNSDPAPLPKRLLDDVAIDLHRLLESANVAPPYVLIGSSGGGFDVYHHAGRYPDDVVGLVMLDVPAGEANLSQAKFQLGTVQRTQSIWTTSRSSGKWRCTASQYGGYR
jgi:pimeloyl-ACP methyl ester carboxylesterase